MIRRNPIHRADCTNSTLVGHAAVDTDKLSWAGQPIIEYTDECFSCGARTNPRRLALPYEENAA